MSKIYLKEVYEISEEDFGNLVSFEEGRYYGMAIAEKDATNAFNEMYSGKSTDNTLNYDKQEINSYMEL